jgi:hypothetical protein
MPLLSKKAVRELRLSSILLDKLREFSTALGQNSSGSSSDIIKRLIDIPVS